MENMMTIILNDILFAQEVDSLLSNSALHLDDALLLTDVAAAKADLPALRARYERGVNARADYQLIVSPRTSRSRTDYKQSLIARGAMVVRWEYDAIIGSMQTYRCIGLAAKSQTMQTPPAQGGLFYYKVPSSDAKSRFVGNLVAATMMKLSLATECLDEDEKAFMYKFQQPGCRVVDYAEIISAETEDVVEPVAVTTAQRVRFAILCALNVCQDRQWRSWAKQWLDGVISIKSADAAEIYAAANQLTAAQYAASAAYWYAEYQIEPKNKYAEFAAWNAANAAKQSAFEADVDLVAIAAQAIAS